VLADLPISSFVAGLLTSRDVKAQAAAIQMAEILMTKLPEVFAGFFVKEGVAHALEQLAAGAGEEAGAAVDAGARAAGEGRRASGSGAGLPPPSPPITRSRRSSKADQVRVQEFACSSFSQSEGLLWLQDLLNAVLGTTSLPQYEHALVWLQ
jgi:E3 ubiquitin-protein ligase TRIP12